MRINGLPIADWDIGGTRAHEIQPTQDISTLNAFLISFFVCSLKLVDYYT